MGLRSTGKRFLKSLVGSGQQPKRHRNGQARQRRTWRSESLEQRLLLTTGLLDPSFGDGGKVLTDLSHPEDLGRDSIFQSGDIAFQSDGKAIVVGTSESGNMLAARYDVDGTLDVTFGASGIATIDVGGFDSAFSVAVDSLNRVVMAGTTTANFLPETFDFAIVRLTEDGTLDATFDVDGKKTFAFDDDVRDVAYDVAIDNLGRITVAGETVDGVVGDIAVARLTDNGDFDATFGVAGKTTIDFGDDQESGTGVAIDSEGRVLVAGITFEMATGFDMAVARLTDTGALDTDFDGDGKQTINFNGSDFGRSVAVDSLDQVVVGGWSHQAGSTGQDFAVARLTDSGALDWTRTIDLGSTSEVGRNITVDEDDRILITGETDQGSGSGFDFGVARLTNIGDLDLDFSGDGIQTIDFGGTDDFPNGVAVDDVGRIFVAGFSAQDASGADFAVARLTNEGVLDNSFDNDGRVLTDLGQPTDDQGYDVVGYQSDGKAVVVGRRDSDFAVIRYNTDGSLDTSFGHDGIVTIDFGFIDVARSVAVDSHDRIVVAGYTDQGGVANNYFAVARLTSSGALDITFDTDGKQTVDFGGTLDQAFGVAVDSGDNVLVAGQSGQVGTGFDFAVAKLTSAGVLDITFDTDGKQTVDFGGTLDLSFGVAVDSGDNVLVAGQSLQDATGWDFAVAKLTSTGALDATFNTDGKRTIDFGVTFDQGVGIAVDSGDNVLVVGLSEQGGTGEDFAVAKLTSTGAFDTAFDTDGKQTIDFGGSSDRAFGVAVDSDDNVLVTGPSWQGATGWDFAVAKLTSGGALDSDFDTDGRQTVDFGSNQDIAWGVAVDGGGNVLVAGESYQVAATGHYDIAVARILNNSPPTLDDQTFSIEENSADETVVGEIMASDPDLPGDTLSFSESGGSGTAAFDVVATTGQIVVADSSLLDFETTTSFTLEVTVTDSGGQSATATMTIDLLNVTALISGTVFVDVDGDAAFDGGTETGIDGVTVTLHDSTGATELGSDVTALGGVYAFTVDDELGTYRIRETQPTGVTDGAAVLGDANGNGITGEVVDGSVLSSNEMQVTLTGIDASDYDFTEIGQAVQAGDTATIGFWQNKNGRALIAEGGQALVDWLNTNFGNVFGNTFSDGVGGDDAAEVANFYKNEFFKKKLKGSPKVDAQFMGTAFATFFTSSDLSGGNVGAGYGFNVTQTGLGTKVVNVGNNGAAFGVADDTDMTVMALLLATNSLTDIDGTENNDSDGYSHVYDADGDGVLDDAEKALRAMANTIYAMINESGDI